VDITLLNCAPIEGYLGSFLLLAIANKDAINIIQIPE
jgi:hypothetical protein